MRHPRTSSFELFPGHKFYLPSYGGVFAILGWYLVGAVLASIVSAVSGFLASPEFTSSYLFLIIYPLQFAPAMIYVSVKSQREEGFDNAGVPLDSSRFSPVGGLWMALMVTVGTFCCAFVVEPSALLLPDMPDMFKKAMEQLTQGPIWSALLTTAVLAPIFEEWLCRGVVLRGLLEHTSPVKAILLSALFFAVIHMNPWQGIPAFALGCLFGLVYWKTGSLKLTMLMHCVNNAVSVVLSRIPGLDEDATMCDLFSEKWQYALVYAACAAVLALCVAKLIKTEFKEK